jgi:hypothetical protein
MPPRISYYLSEYTADIITSYRMILYTLDEFCRDFLCTFHKNAGYFKTTYDKTTLKCKKSRSPKAELLY